MGKKLFIIVPIILVVALIYEEQLRLGWGYDIELEGIITRHGKIVIDHHVLDTRLSHGYLVGIRLPTKDMECHGGLVRAVIDRPTYFILKLDETKVTSFLSRKEFENQVNSLKIKFEDPLKYEFFGNIFKNTKRLDGEEKYKNCLRDNGLTGFRVVSLY